MSKNLQKHWDFRKCAGLRRVVSLSSMRARAWKTTKVPSATRRTRCNRSLLVTKCSSPVRSPNETLRTALCSPAIDPGLRVETSQLQHAFESRTTLRTDARSLASCPSRRISHSSRQWANGGPTTRLPLWHSQAPNDGSSPKNQRVLGPREQPRYSTQFVFLVRATSAPFSQGDFHGLGYSHASGIEAIQRSRQACDCKARIGRGGVETIKAAANNLV